MARNPFGFLSLWCEYLDALGDILVRSEVKHSQSIVKSVFASEFGFNLK
jgi:hypothetical protein